jgi:pimeloyl-ACP methyl ester carboxylesterase
MNQAKSHLLALRPRRTAHVSALRPGIARALIGTAAALGSAAVSNVMRAREAERKHPPIGRFVDVDGVRVHVLVQGRGAPVLLIHGNGTMIEDFTVSGLVGQLALRHRVVAIDRPGYGYSARPRRSWTPRAQARLFKRALDRLGIASAIVYGHSWGTLVAVALALDFPALVRGLVLGAGYYYPEPRPDALLFAAPAVPVIGDIMRYTISPLIAAQMLPRMLEQVFLPASVPARFARFFPTDLMLRPAQLRAAAEDAALMMPAAAELAPHYPDIRVPVAIVAGTEDRIVDIDRHSARLHRELGDSAFIALPGVGHMVHHLATDAVAGAIEKPRSDPPARDGQVASRGLKR